MASSNVFILIACFILLGFSSMEVSLATRNIQHVSLIEVSPITLSLFPPLPPIRSPFLPPMTLAPITLTPTGTPIEEPTDPPTEKPTDPPTEVPTLP
ncbi:hypothetical protein E1A91_A03G166700v1 [Gossypium mustelinum]|uniref:Uncharacterized protein n=1 Tax=Gossypium mustelinum TaxID=34275 RepID=A0A5D2ZY72_GOSMU|nr:hypothetical protein E1A91_A03G166700v1 [Gossypium mustelinum]